MIGTTRYHYQNYFQKIIIAASYSFYPLRTVPGSIISRQALGLVGFLHLIGALAKISIF